MSEWWAPAATKLVVGTDIVVVIPIEVMQRNLNFSTENYYCRYQQKRRHEAL